MSGSNFGSLFTTAIPNSLHVIVSEDPAVLACASKVLCARYKGIQYGPITRHFEPPKFAHTQSLFAQTPIHLFDVSNATEGAALSPPSEGVFIVCAPKSAMVQSLQSYARPLNLPTPPASALQSFAQQYAQLLGVEAPSGPFYDILDATNAVECSPYGRPGAFMSVDANTFTQLRAVLQGGSPTLLEPFRSDPLYFLGAVKYVLRTMGIPLSSVVLDIEGGLKSSEPDAWVRLIGYILSVRGQHYAALLNQTEA